jgi:hypothetical protein
MGNVVLDGGHDDPGRRRALFAGDLLILPARPASLALAALARQLLEEAFHPWHPAEAQHFLPVEQYASVLGRVKPAFIHHPRCKALIRDLMVEVGVDPGEAYFDVPRLRSATSDDYLSSGIAYAFHPHRDTWYSAPQAQINWWLPVYEMVPANGMAVYPDWFARAVPNSSECYNYYRWNAESRASADKQIGADTRVQPRLTTEINLENEIRVSLPVGGMLAFSGHHLHATVHNTTGVTRFSIDFRTVHIGDLESGQGAPRTDVRCTGTTLRDFHRAADLEPLSRPIIEMYDDESALEYVDTLVFAPS